MKELLFQSNVGIQFNKEIRNGMCSVKVQSQRSKRAYTIQKYVYPDVELETSSPFLSWENLNCCNGWIYDEAYLFTAVQDGKKLYAGCSILLSSPKQAEDAEARYEAIKESLPETCVAGKEVVHNENYFPFYICRKGRLKDFFDLDHILTDYERMGVRLSPQDRDMLFTLGDVELSQFALEEPMCYHQLKSDAEAVATGLLLGYPLESTASLLLRS